MVVGQGLAGTLVSFALFMEGRKFVVMDSGMELSASSVAAGMWNPIGFRRLGFTWRAMEFLPVMLETFRKMETIAGKSFAHEMPVQKKIPGEAYADNWEALRKSPQYASWLSPLYTAPLKGKEPLLWGDVLGSGYLDLGGVLRWWKEFLSGQNQYREEQVSYTDFVPVEKGVFYRDIFFDRVIFCEGVNARKNPWFPNLPIQCNKGELLSLQANGLETNKVLNNGKFLLPMENGRGKLGSTYEWWKEDTLPEESNRSLLLKKAQELLPDSYQITGHQAGLRPTVADRRPLVGQSSRCANMWLLNGLGTRGVMIGPFWAAYLLDMIFRNREPDPETAIDRFD